MLHMLGQRQLDRSRFPVGALSKGKTRALAERFALPVANKPDSQELCFAPSGDAGAFLRRVAPHVVRAGEVVGPDGAVLGAHAGAAAFTVGQRRGLGVSAPEPRYVLEVDVARNRVVVGPGELLERRGLVADRAHWVAGAPPADGPFEAEVRLRYRGEDVPAVLEAAGDRVRVEFLSPQRGVAPGQSAVVSRGDEVLGGARIVESVR
jgi:tRNA-specific 2-thiouridylase